MERIMKPKTISRLLIGSLLTGLSGLASAELFEDFSGPISLTKFWGMEETIQLDTTNEKLILTSKAKAYTAGYRSNTLSMQSHTGVSLLQADISVTEVTLGNANTQNAMLGIAGTYYNANSASTTSELGDVFARIALGDRGNGPEAWYELQVSTDENFFTSTITTGSFGTITLGTAYTASITYDGDNTLTYQFNNGTAVNLDGPPRLENQAVTGERFPKT